MKNVIIATGNAGKVKEFREMLAGLDIVLTSLADRFDPLPDIAETGSTFYENAKIKADWVYDNAGGIWSLADDSGLEVDALGGAPGVLSARYGGVGADAARNNEKLLNELRGIPEGRRTARFKCALVLKTGVDTYVTAEGRCEGRIIDKAAGVKGFGYDPLFIPDGFDRTFAQLDSEEKHEISHRGNALKKLYAELAAFAAALMLCIGCGGKGTGDKPAAGTADINIEMVYVEGGAFTMGCAKGPDDDCAPIDEPAHSVTVNDFYISKYECTQGLWAAVMGNNPSRFNDDDNLPVERVSWDDVQTFIRKINAMTGRKYRLPTEAEWEYAARGGYKSAGYSYSGSDNDDKVAWHSGNSGETRRPALKDGRTRPVGTREANELGIHDMSGNVWEWVNDFFGKYDSGAQANPRGPSNGLGVYRGGSWDTYSATTCRVYSRGYGGRASRYNSLGFRLALSP